MKATCEPWGESDGVAVERYVLERDGIRATFTNFGAALIALEVPDRNGARADVVLGFDSLAEYASPRNPYFGSIVGRCANRIAGARFELDERAHVLAANEGRHHLHGGVRGFDRRAWSAELDAHAARVVFARTSPAGEEGYPGALRVLATYALSPGGVLELEISAACDAPTLWNPTQHSYFNLAGLGGDVGEHRLEVRASRVLAVDAELIPTGELIAIDGARVDLRGATGAGLDHCFALDAAAARGRDASATPRLACRLTEPRSGRVLEIEATQPGLQVYTGNGLGELVGKRGVRYPRHGGICLETQGFPDAVHHAHFPSVVLRPGERRRDVTRWRFSAT
ncbi:MAG: galactose mutarotase [Planctomycetota bacterium]|nr:MAG: galactose mutarotase [Planctomycetota bacterium]